MAIGARRPLAGTAWNVWRGVIGFAYLAAAVFNGIYTLPRTDEPGLLEGYAEGAWSTSLGDFMHDVVMPNDATLMVLVIFFEVAVGLSIMSRGGWVDLGVAASLIWVVGILPFLAWPYLLTNVALALLQGVVVLRRYEVPVWTRVVRSLSVSLGTPHTR